jgi:hypothetical protein
MLDGGATGLPMIADNVAAIFRPPRATAIKSSLSLAELAFLAISSASAAYFRYRSMVSMKTPEGPNFLGRIRFHLGKRRST